MGILSNLDKILSLCQDWIQALLVIYQAKCLAHYTNKVFSEFYHGSHDHTSNISFFQAVVSQTENPNAKSVPPPEGPKHMVRPDEVKSVIEQHNSIIHKLTDNGISTIDSLQNAATSTVYNLSWYATSLLSNTLKILSNTMQTAKDVGVNTLNAGVRVGMNTMRMADGVVRGALSLAKIGTHGVGNQLSSASGFFKNVSQHPDALNMSQVRVTPNM